MFYLRAAQSFTRVRFPLICSLAIGFALMDCGNELAAQGQVPSPAQAQTAINANYTIAGARMNEIEYLSGLTNGDENAEALLTQALGAVLQAYDQLTAAQELLDAWYAAHRQDPISAQVLWPQFYVQIAACVNNANDWLGIAKDKIDQASAIIFGN